MSALSGFFSAALQQGLESILIKPRRAIGEFEAQVVICERHQDDLEITDHPIEQGAVVSDHAYIRPAEVVIQCGWSNSPSNASLLSGIVGAISSTVSFAQQVADGAVQSVVVQEIYEKLLNLQKGRQLFDIYTGKRAYTNMLIRSLVVETDQKSENALMVTATCREVNVVKTEVLTVPDNANHADPAATGSPVNSGAKQLQSAPNYFNPQAGP